MESEDQAQSPCLDCWPYASEESGHGHTVCTACGKSTLFKKMPLLILGGASGTGKSTVGAHLMGSTEKVVVLESDVLWRDEFNRDIRGFFDTLLRLCRNIGQSGKPVLLIGAGAAVTDNIESSPERLNFSEVHYMALHCLDEEMNLRLRNRHGDSEGVDALIDTQIGLNRWFKTNAMKVDPPIELVDTNSISIAETVRFVTQWIDEKLAGPSPTPTLDVETPSLRDH